jgi:hypothetical protein
LLKAALLSKSTYYFEINKPDIDIKNEKIIEKIKNIFFENKKRYGVRRVTAELHNQGVVVNHKKVQRIMNKFKLKATKTKIKYHSYIGEVGHIADNIINRDFEASKPNEKWTTDVSQFNCPFGKNRSSYNSRIESNLKSFVERLQTIEHSFSSLNFDQIDLSQLSSNDFVYCDHPYLITTGSYNDGKRGFTGWGVSEERALLNILSDLNVRGVKFALSNVVEHKGRTNELLKEWIESNGFIMHVLSMNYNNSNYQATNKEKKTLEVLVTNY